jgi:ubiquinone/menaquinone biosynthesis C-methylase UbiE
MLATKNEETSAATAFFDERADAYDREYNDQTTGGYSLRIRREKVLRFFDQPGGKVLDVGCGPAVMAQEIAARGCEFWGVDPAEKMLDICRRRVGGRSDMHFELGYATQLAFPDQFFDAVLCMGVIDAVEDRSKAVREMLRVLKPGGTLIITFTNVASPYSWWKRYVFYDAVTAFHAVRRFFSPRRARVTLPPNPRGRSLYTVRRAHGLLKSEGAEVLATQGYYFNIFLAPLDELFPSLAVRVTRKLEEGRWPRPEWIAAGWIIKARKGKEMPNHGNR